MKKVLLICFMLVIALMLVGCDENTDDKIKITFKLDDFSYIVEIEKGTSITEEIIPLVQINSYKLYYDENYLNEYNDEIIEENTDIYIKLCINENVDIVEQAKEAYFYTYVKPNREDAVIEDVILYENLGTYNGVFVGLYVDSGVLYPMIGDSITVADITFFYEFGYNICVYNGTSIMSLWYAYEQSLLTYEDLLQIYKLHTDGR